MSVEDISTDSLDHLVELSHDTSGVKDCSIWLIRDNTLDHVQEAPDAAPSNQPETISTTQLDAAQSNKSETISTIQRNEAPHAAPINKPETMSTTQRGAAPDAV